MVDYMDFFNRYIMGVLEMVFVFYIFSRLLNRRVWPPFYILFAASAAAVIYFVPMDSIARFGVFALLLAAGGILFCHADGKSVALCAALVILILQLSYGIMKSLLSILYPFMFAVFQDKAGIIFWLAGDMASLLLAGFCYHAVYRYFSDCTAAEMQSIFLVFIPVLMIFMMDEYINSVVYGWVVTEGGGTAGCRSNHWQMLIIQLLGTASLFCILSAYKKLLQNFRLRTELALLEQEEHSLNRYVEEAETRYEKTKSFRHDVKNHVAVIKNLLQSGKPEQALNYVENMEEIAEELSFPCITNNPVVDVLAGNKLGIAKSMGIDVSCSLFLPHPCGLRDIDLCIILSNALDNAIHACKNMDGSSDKFIPDKFIPDKFIPDKFIRISGRMQGDFLMLEIENSFQGNSIFREGTGLSNIKAAAEKYHGAVSIKMQDNVFALHVLLIIPQHPESSLRQMD